MKPTYEELETALVNTQTELANTQTELAKMHHLLKLALERIAVLEEQLNKNSKNSSKPPSTDQKSNSTGSKNTRKNRSKGVNRKSFPPDQVNHFVDCSLESCPLCGSKELSELDKTLSLQQVDLPEVKPIVTQYNCKQHRCESCGTPSFARLPEGVPDSAFGIRLMALITALTGALHLSKRDAIWLVKNLYDIDISEGSIINVEERVASALKQVYERIHRHVTQSLLPKHFDETSWRDRGKTHYVWTASTLAATCLHIDRSRSREAFQGFIETLSQAPVVTDRYAVYNQLEQPHQYCLAHLIRECRKYSERDGPDGKIGNALEKELIQVCRNHREFREGLISKQARNGRFRHQKKRLENYLLDGFIEGSKEIASFCDRLLDSFSHLWVFSNFTDVEPTNNLAERDLRRIVLWRKKSYGTRSDRGQRYVERIGSVVQTLKKAGANILEFIQRAVSDFYQGKSDPMINSVHEF